MKTWVKWTIGVAVTGLVCFGVLAGVGAYYVVRHLDKATASEGDTLKDADAVRARFGTRAPLIEIVDLRTADIRLNRSVDPSHRPVTTIHILAWNGADNERVRTDLPLWLMRFSSVNILSSLGVAPDRFRLTVDDIVRYGPGIVVDYRQPGKQAALVWVD